MIEHPNYIAGSELCRRTQKDPFFRTDEKSQFIVMLKFRDQTGLESAIFVSVLVLVSVVLSRSQSVSTASVSMPEFWSGLRSEAQIFGLSRFRGENFFVSISGGVLRA